jgi:organic radical activating enzyme
VVSHLDLLDVIEQVGSAARHDTVTIALQPGPGSQATQRLVAEWCRRAGHELLELRTEAVVIRRGPALDPMASLDPALLPGTRLWMYTNFDCNLACDYCCARSSPQTDRNPLGLERVQKLAVEASDAGVRELILTGGEPFLLPDIDEVVSSCTTALPTTLLTNGMLFQGRRLQALQRMDTSRLALQISLDSATPELHDQHRGPGSWAKAVNGIRTAHENGFRVRVAATLSAQRTHELAPFHEFLDNLEIAREDQVIRAVAHRGFATDGVELTLASLVPEVTATADGIYWHPVTAGHNDQLVTRDLFPLAAAIDEVRRRFAELRAETDSAAQWFPCA